MLLLGMEIRWTLDANRGGKETLLVNAAVKGDMKGWYVDIGL